MGKKRKEPGEELTPGEAFKQLLRLFKNMFEKFGILPDILKQQDLEFFSLVRAADEKENDIPLSYPEDADFT